MHEKSTALFTVLIRIRGNKKKNSDVNSILVIIIAIFPFISSVYLCTVHCCSDMAV